MRSGAVPASGVLLAGVLLAGCATRPGAWAGEPAPSARRPELQLLDMFLGRWEASGEIRGAAGGAPATFTGTSEARWEGDGTFLVSRGVTTRPGGGESHGIAAWTFDPRSGLYRAVSANTSGSVATGTARYEPATGTWIMELHGEGPEGTSLWNGRVRFVDADTKEERWEGSVAGAGAEGRIGLTKTERRVGRPSTIPAQ